MWWLSINPTVAQSGSVLNKAIWVQLMTPMRMVSSCEPALSTPVSRGKGTNYVPPAAKRVQCISFFETKFRTPYISSCCSRQGLRIGRSLGPVNSAVPNRLGNPNDYRSIVGSGAEQLRLYARASSKHQVGDTPYSHDHDASSLHPPHRRLGLYGRRHDRPAVLTILGLSLIPNLQTGQHLPEKPAITSCFRRASAKPGTCVVQPYLSERSGTSYRDEGRLAATQARSSTKVSSLLAGG